MVPLRETAPLRGMAVASVSLGFWSLIVFWWFPYSLVISSAGLALGVISMGLRVRGLHGENYGLIGATLSAIALSIILTLTQVLHILLWK